MFSYSKVRHEGETADFPSYDNAKIIFWKGSKETEFTSLSDWFSSITANKLSIGDITEEFLSNLKKDVILCFVNLNWRNTLNSSVKSTIIQNERLHFESLNTFNRTAKESND